MKYYYLVSGGRDSTAMVLLAHEKGEKHTLVFGDTRLNSGRSRKNILKLQKYTGWPLRTARYEGEKKPIEVLKESFLKIPQALEYLEEKGVFRRNMFGCCDTLKHRPMNDLIKTIDKKVLDSGTEACLVLGIKGSDSAIHRIYRMRQLRELDTFYRRHKATGLLYYYPLRDSSVNDINEVLSRHGFADTHSSGCGICPIFCMFESWRKKDPDAWRRSVQFADRLGIEHPAAGQTFFRDCLQ